MYDLKQYLKLNDITDESETLYLSYLDFKNWLYFNFPQFIDKEYETDHWKYTKNKQTIEVRISTYWTDTEEHKAHDQYIGVGFENRKDGFSGWSVGCEVLEEVKMWINRALETMGEKKRIGADYNTLIERKEQISLF